MVTNQILVGLGEIQAVQGDATLMCVGLGSCLAVCIGDPTAKVWGVAHVMLPRAHDGTPSDRPAKFADTGVPALVDILERLGAKRESLRATIVGGAQVVHGNVTRAMLEFGARNVQAAKEQLDLLGITQLDGDTGGNNGRTMTFDTRTGLLSVRTPISPDKLVCKFEGGNK